MKTLRALVVEQQDSSFYDERKDEIRFELNHLELHGLDEYLLICFNKGVRDEENEGNSNIKYLLDMTNKINPGGIKTIGGNFPD